MSLLIVAATQAELEPFIARLQFKRQKSATIKSYELNGLMIDILFTGVGMVATTYWLTKALIQSKYDFAINAGIAGSFNSLIGIGTVVYTVSETFSELGAEDGNSFLNLIDLHLMKNDEFPFSSGILKNQYMIKSEILKTLPKVTGITVNKVHGNVTSINKVEKLYNPDVESMEGAAFYYCCMMEYLPCIQIRAISNKVELRDRSKWNIPLAINNLNSLLFDIIIEKKLF